MIAFGPMVTVPSTTVTSPRTLPSIEAGPNTDDDVVHGLALLELVLLADAQHRLGPSRRCRSGISMSGSWPSATRESEMVAREPSIEMLLRDRRSRLRRAEARRRTPPPLVS